MAINLSEPQIPIIFLVFPESDLYSYCFSHTSVCWHGNQRLVSYCPVIHAQLNCRTSGGSRGGWGAAGARTPPPPRKKTPKRPDFGQNMLQNASFEALDIKIFQGSMSPYPSRAYKRLTLPAVVSIFWSSWKKSATPPPRLSIPRSATEAHIPAQRSKYPV